MKKEKKDNIYMGLTLSAFLALDIIIAFCGVDKMYTKIQGLAVGLLLVVAIIAVILPLTRKSKMPWWAIAGMLLCLTLLIYAVIVICVVVPERFQTATTSVLGASVGGLFTIYGVGLTIKASRTQKEEDDIEKAKPNVFVVSNEKPNSKDGLTKNNICPDINISLSTLKPAKDQKDFYSFAPFSLANSDQAMCTIQGVTINNSLAIVFQYDNVLLKGSKNRLTVDYDFDLEEDLQSIELVLGDMLGNLYSCNVSFSTKTSGKKKKKTTISILGVCGLAPIDEKLAKSFQPKNAPVEK